jgi:phosphatidylglycerophosphate synthase
MSAWNSSPSAFFGAPPAEPRVFDDLLRGLKDRLLDPLAQLLGPKVSPTLVSALSCLAGLAAALLLARGLATAALGCWLLSRTLDGLDGTLARRHARATDFGAYVDILFDFLVYAAIPIGLVAGRPSPGAYPALAALLATFYVNAASWMYLSALLERRGRGAAATGEATAVTMPGGLVAGTETILFYAAFMIWPERAVVLMLAMAALVAVGIVQRVVWASRRL